jgi:hypothetical protein
VQIRSAIVGNLANYGVFVVVMQDFGSVEMKLGGEQHAHNQGMYPKPEPRFSPASHFDNFALP